MQIFAPIRSAGAVKELQRTTNKDPRREHSGIPGERGDLCPVSLSFDLTRMPGQTVASMSTDSEADVPRSLVFVSRLMGGLALISHSACSSTYSSLDATRLWTNEAGDGCPSPAYRAISSGLRPSAGTSTGSGPRCRPWSTALRLHGLSQAARPSRLNPRSP